VVCSGPAALLGLGRSSVVWPPTVAPPAPPTGRAGCRASSSEPQPSAPKLAPAQRATTTAATVQSAVRARTGLVRSLPALAAPAEPCDAVSRRCEREASRSGRARALHSNAQAYRSRGPAYGAQRRSCVKSFTLSERSSTCVAGRTSVLQSRAFFKSDRASPRRCFLLTARLADCSCAAQRDLSEWGRPTSQQN
jgi:hypothetical protein